jgi:uncharacterized protein (DUF2147 family)
MLVALAALAATPAAAQAPVGTWLVEHKAAVRLFDCQGALCGRVVWLRDPALRTAEMCNRTIIWGLQPAGTGQWTDGSFLDPEDGSTYHVEMTQDSSEELSANVYPAVSWLGETVNLIRIAPYSLNGWCS